jgi:hypothetical protein
VFRPSQPDAPPPVSTSAACFMLHFFLPLSIAACMVAWKLQHHWCNRRVANLDTWLTIQRLFYLTATARRHPGGWRVTGRVVAGRWQRPATTRPTTLHVCKTSGCQCSFRLLMMGGVSPKTCWTSYKYEINCDTLMHLIGFF